MIATSPAPRFFVGRGPLLRRLERFHRAGKCVLLFGPKGSGKTSVLVKLAEDYPMLYAPNCGSLGELLGALEPQAGLEAGEAKLAARVHRLAARLPRIGRSLVLDNVGRAPPRVAHLVRTLLANMPVWLAVRSVLPLEIGHLWPYLFMFKRVDLHPFSLDETRAFLAEVPYAGDRAPLVAAALRLHRLSAGHPATLANLVAEMGARSSDLTTANGIHLLALHTRITQVETQLGRI